MKSPVKVKKTRNRPCLPSEPRFWTKVDKTGANGCWIWLANVNSKGYGMFKHAAKTQTAHRVSWQLANGEISEGLHVLHRCDNPSCVNTAHLYLGTHRENMDDMVAKRRHLFGERQNKAKLTEKQVLEIRSRITGRWGEIVRIAEEYGVSAQTVSAIKQRVVWSHI